MKTVGVDLWGGQVRDGAQNRMTRMAPAPSLPMMFGLRDLFIHAYATFAGPCRDVEEPGVALVAVDERTGRAVGLVRLRARVDRHVAAIVGRHNQCDMFLDGSDELALRHLAVVLDPVQTWRAGDARAHFRVLDLRTNTGFVDESGRTLRGLRAEGPALIRCAGHAIFALPLGDRTDWPASAEDAWAFLPERVYFDETERSASGSSAKLPKAVSLVSSADHRRSAITRTHGPRDTGMKLVERGDLAGVLELVGPHHRGTIQVGQDALRDGILLGRYARCDSSMFADDPSLSRVHALLLQVDDAVLVIDTASRNGTSAVGESRARVIALRGNTELQLGWATRARWSWLA